MRLVTFACHGRVAVGARIGDNIFELQTPDMITLLAGGLRAVARAVEAVQGNRTTQVHLSDVTLLPPIPRPGKIICLGLNYFDHAVETGRTERPEHPIVFMRGPTSLVAHNQPIEFPKVSTKLDYEAEMVAVIGKTVRAATSKTALEAVIGYSAFNDGSVRDVQMRTPQWTLGKNFDRTGGFGPEIVTADELPPGGAGLKIECRLNGAIMQSANTTDMIFDVREAVVRMSECMTLEPGDLLVMGTPGGIGAARKPPVWMKPGDVCEIEIEKIGTLRNPIATAS